jgi:hypothetical protein
VSAGPDVDGPHVLIVGTMVEGFEFVGPFTTHDELEAYADANPVGDDWQSAPLNGPEGYSAILAAILARLAGHGR